MSGKIHNFLIPNVAGLPGAKKAATSDVTKNSEKYSEFKNLLKEQIDDINNQFGVKISTHAAKRIGERNLDIDNKEIFKVKDALNRLNTKGGRDSLVVTGKAAYIVDVEKSTIVTAMNKDEMKENVFTKIDSMVFMN